MQRRRAVLILTWLVGTIMAMGLVQGSVQLLTQRVRHESVPTLDAGAIDEELLSSPTAGSIASGTSLRAGTTTTTTGGDPTPAGDPAPADPGDLGGALPAGTAPATPPTTPRAPSAPPTVPPTTRPTVPAVAPSTSPSTSTPVTSTPPSQTRTFTSAGGSIVVQCTADAVQLVSYHPAVQFSARIDRWGPDEVEVRFLGPDTTTKISVECRSGVADAEIHVDGGEDADDHDEARAVASA